jgi:hypothetical protein
MKENYARILGFWSSVFVAVLGVAYLSMLSVFFATEGFVFPPSEIIQLLGGIITFLTVPGLIVVFTAIYHTNSGEKNVFGSLGITFITLFAATVSINRFVQLTIIQQSEPGAASLDLARFLPYSTSSVMFSLEMLGWGFFSSMAALAVAPLFVGNRLNNVLRWTFIFYAIFSFAGVIGFAIQSPITSAAFVAWGPILLVMATLLAVYFQRQEKTIGNYGKH